MARKYGRRSMGEGPLVGQGYTRHHPTVPDVVNYSNGQDMIAGLVKPPPVYRDISLYLEDIPRGKTVTLTHRPKGELSISSLLAESFVYSGSRDLWLLPTSAVEHCLMFEEPIPLDTFRIGAPLQVSWPSIRTGYNGSRIVLEIENRGRARNDGMGTFAARLNCLVQDERR